jgi:hypothetical protein
MNETPEANASSPAPSTNVLFVDPVTKKPMTEAEKAEQAFWDSYTEMKKKWDEVVKADSGIAGIVQKAAIKRMKKWWEAQR